MIVIGGTIESDPVQDTYDPLPWEGTWRGSNGYYDDAVHTLSGNPMSWTGVSNSYQGGATFSLGGGATFSLGGTTHRIRGHIKSAAQRAIKLALRVRPETARHVQNPASPTSRVSGGMSRSAA